MKLTKGLVCLSFCVALTGFGATGFTWPPPMTVTYPKVALMNPPTTKHGEPPTSSPPNPNPATRCPPLNSRITPKYCTCYPSTGLMSCTNLDATFIHEFHLDGVYHIDSLVITNSNYLPLFTEHFTTSQKLIINSLIIDGGVYNLQTPVNNIEGLFPFVTRSIEIIGAREYELDLEDLSETLTSLSISHVRMLQNFDLNKMKALESLQLKDTELEPSLGSLSLLESSLHRLHITGTTQLRSFLFKPHHCYDKKQIHIDLSNNAGLEMFDFSYLIGSECNFAVDLSDNLKLRQDLLTLQIGLLKKLEHGQLYLTLRNVKLNCDRCLYDLYQDRKDYIHSVYCSNVGRFLDEITDPSVLGSCFLN